ncbi:MAG: RNA pyrophosphohydrolase [Hyphomicrobiaceae bacterium hypho_1]
MSEFKKNFEDYRPCVGAMIINKKGHIWMGLRVDIPENVEGPGNWWQMPQGGVDPGENLEVAVVRELFEETGIKSIEILGRTRDWLYYDLPSDLQNNIWSGKYKGQKQIWFAVRFTGNESEINIDPPKGLNYKKEFLAWKWMPIYQIADSVVPFKHDLYVQVVKQLKVYALSIK